MQIILQSFESFQPAYADLYLHALDSITVRNFIISPYQPIMVIFMKRILFSQPDHRHAHLLRF